MQSVAPFAESTRFFTISTAGHVDHGKTSLLRALTGIDPDRLKEEKERQMTTDLGFAFLRLDPDLVAGFVDVPGHGRFLKNMLAGVGGLDMALLVVAADEGPMPQTIQHVRILGLLGVSAVLVVITKIDACDNDRLLHSTRATAELLSEHHMNMVAVCSVSSTKGTGIDELKATLARVLSELPRRPLGGAAFLPVDRVFSKQGFGTVVTGTLVRGTLAVGDAVSLAPDMVQGRVRRLETHGEIVERVQAGQRVACNVVMREAVEITRGCVVVGGAAEPSRLLIVALRDAPRSAEVNLAEAITDQPVRLYHGTAECHGRVRWAENGSLRETATSASAGSASDACDEAIAFIALSEPIVAEPQDRFVIRLADEAIYGGTVLVCEKPKWMTRRNALEFADSLLKADFAEAVMQALEAAPHSTITLKTVKLFVPDIEASAVLHQLVEKRRLCRLGDCYLPAEARTSLSRQTHDLLTASAAGGALPLEKLRLSLKPRLDREAFAAFLDEESADGKVVRRGDRVAVAGVTDEVLFSPEVLRARNFVMEFVQEQFCIEQTVVVEHLQGSGFKNIEVVDQLVKGGQLTRVDKLYLATAANVQKAHVVLDHLWTHKRNIPPGEFREMLGTTRKYAMALLAYFDDRNITRRVNDRRALLKPVEKPADDG